MIKVNVNPIKFVLLVIMAIGLFIGVVQIYSLVTGGETELQKLMREIRPLPSYNSSLNISACNAGVCEQASYMFSISNEEVVDCAAFRKTQDSIFEPVNCSLVPEFGNKKYQDSLYATATEAYTLASKLYINHSTLASGGPSAGKSSPETFTGGELYCEFFKQRQTEEYSAMVICINKQKKTIVFVAATNGRDSIIWSLEGQNLPVRLTENSISHVSNGRVIYQYSWVN